MAVEQYRSPICVLCPTPSWTRWVTRNEETTEVLGILNSTKFPVIVLLKNGPAKLMDYLHVSALHYCSVCSLTIAA